jgi:hypothetical protein
VGEDVSELSFPEGNRSVHGSAIEANSRELAAGERSFEIDPFLILQGLHVNLHDVVCTRQKTGLAGAQSVGKEWDREP